MAVISLMLLSACTSNRAPSGPGEPAGKAGSSLGTGPPRPREIRLDGRDPCALIPKSDWPLYYIEKPGTLKSDDTLKAPKCRYSNSVGLFAITLVTSESIGAWHNGERAAKPHDLAPIKGFPTISVQLPNNDLGCDVAVDVAQGQYLMATVILDSDKAPRLPELCVYAHRLAESAMNTLAP